MNLDGLNDSGKDIFRQLQKMVYKCFNSDWKLIEGECSIYSYKIKDSIKCFFCEKIFKVPNIDNIRTEKRVQKYYVCCPYCHEKLVIIFNKIPFLEGRPQREFSINNEDILNLKISLNSNNFIDSL